MRAMLSVVVLPLAVTGAVAAPAASPSGSKSFSGWTATCNNLGACVVIGTAQDDLFYIRIARDAGATAAPEIKIVLAAQSELKGRAPAFRLDAVSDGKTEPLGPYPATTSDPFTARVAAGDAGTAFVDKIRNATKLRYALLSAKGTVELTGLSAALRWVDARQGRAGTPTAFVAKGMTPIGQVPPPRAAPAIVAERTQGVAEISKPIVSPALLQRAMAQSDCEKDVVKAHTDIEAWRLAPDLVLIAVPCLQGAYQSSAALYFTNAKGDAPRPVLLPHEPGGGDGEGAANIVTNVGFDPKTLVLSHFGKGRGIADCGDSRTWVWTGRDFALLEAAALEACPGALPDDWPNIYTAVRK